MNLRRHLTTHTTFCFAIFSILTLGFGTRLSAQLTGTKNIPGDYATLALAITDLNTVGVGAGGVIFNVLPGNPQTAPAGGYVIGGAGSAIVIGGAAPTSLANNVQINGNGNVIMASGAHTAGSLTDAVFKLVGADFIGIQNCLIQENPANTVTTPASNTMTEWGIALLYVTTTDGAQNNAFATNAISLNRTYTNTWGIYSNVRHSATTPGTTADITNGTTAPNSGNRVYANTISNVNMGIAFIGSGTAANMDVGNDIGGTSALTGNTITNWGGAAAASTYISNSGVSYCIFMNHQTSSNVSYNTLTSATVSGTSATFRGISQDFTTAAPTATFTNVIGNNTITLNSAFTSGTFQHIFSSIAAAAAGATLNITNNNLLNSAVSGAASSSAMVGIANTGAYGVLSITGNVMRGWTSTATTGGMTGISNTGAIVTSCTISNNQIGNAAGGIITFSAATTGAILGITSSGAAATCATTIQGNDIRGIVQSAVGSGSHTYITSTGAALTNLVSGNTFTNLNANTTASVTFISHSYSMPAGGSQTITNNSIVTGFNKGGAGGTVTMTTTNGSSPNGTTSTVTNNNFSNVTVTGATGITGINNTDGSSSSPAKICTGNVLNNWTGGTSAILAINYGYIGAVTSSISNNTVTNMTGQAAVTGIQIGNTFNGATTLTIANNTVTNLSSTGAGGAVTGMSCANTSTTVNMNNNTVGTLSSTGAAAVNGIVVSGATVNNVFVNKVCDLTGSNASSTVNGMVVSGSSTGNVFNNLIGDLKAPIANATNPVIGLSITGGTTVNAHFNTVRIAATSSGTNFGSSAVSVSSTPTVVLRNNIFVNLSTANGTGLTVAHRRSSTTLGTYGAASNNNLFFAGTPSATNLIFNDGTNSDQTLAAYKARVSARDNAAVTENPTFLSTTCGSTSFLHIDPSVATQAESGGITVAGVTTDFDGDTRNGSTPDIGADEGTFIPLDVAGPVINYTPLIFTCLTGDRTFTATISDFTGVPTTGGFQPRVYFRKNGGTWFSTQGTLSSGNAISGTWTFNIVAATMGGLVLGDIVEYYVIAQDIVTPTPNLNSSPSTGLVATDVNTVTTAPTTPNSYPISGTLSGTYTVGAAGVFPTLTAAITAYNNNCLGGPVIFSLIDPTYNEAGAMTTIKHPDASAINTLTIRPATGVTAAVNATVANGFVIRILGDYVTIDGSNNGSTTRDLTISNLSTTTPNVVVLGSNGTTPNTSVTVKNSILINGVNTSSAVVVSDAGVFGNPGYFTNVSFLNNSVQRAFIGFFCNLALAPGNGAGLTISDNSINTSGANAIRRVGVYVQGADGATVSGNTIGNFDATAAENDFGIWIAAGTVNTTVSGNTISGLSCTQTGNAPTAINVTPAVASANITVTNNTISAITSAGGSGGASTNGISLTGASSSVTITRNTITNIKNTSSTGWGACGILLGSTSTTANVLVANNFVSDVAGYGFNGSTVDDNGNGIAVTAGAGYNIYHNTVHLTGNQTLTGGLPAAILVGVNVTAPGAINLRNNIFSNTMTVGTQRYAINCAAPNTVFAAIDFNDYVSAGPNLGLIATVNRVDIAAIQAGFGGNLNSVNIAPTFVSGTDLHLIPASNTALNDLGTGIPAVTVDIDLASRSATTPDMGADEFDLPLCTGTPTAGTATVSVTPICEGTPTTLTVTGFTTGVAGISFQWQGASVPGGPYTNIPGATTTTYNYTTAPAGVNYIVCRVTCSGSGNSALTPEIILTVNPRPVASVNPTTARICYPTAVGTTLNASATGGTGALTYTWSPTLGISSGTGATVTALPLSNTTYTVTVTDANLCTSTAASAITVGSAVTVSSVTATPSTICAGSTTSLDVTATGGVGSNYTISTVPFAPIATGTGTVVLSSAGTATTALTSGTLDDGYWNGINIPFPFNYFGTLYGSIHVGTNGFISFSPLSTNTGYASSPQIPNTATPNNIVAGAFGDMEWRFGGVISTYTSGTAPNRIFVVDFNGSTGGGWYNVGSAPTVLTNFQIQLHEAGNLIQVHTTSTPTSTQNHTMGIENSGGTAGFVVSGRDNSLWSLANDGTQFAPSAALTYAWTPALGLTPSATVQNPTTGALTGNTTFSVTVSESNGCTATGSVPVTVTPNVTPSVSITANPGTTICDGSSVTFTAVPVNGGATPVYQWKKNGGNVGTNSTTYTDAALVNGDVITVELTSNANCAAPATVTSNSLTMVVNPLLTPSVSITANPGTTICAGTSVTFTAVPTNGGATPAYQWKKNGGNVGTNSTTYTDAGLVNGDVITVELTSNATCATPATVTSNSLTMVVNPLLTPSVTITANPGTNICAGTNVTFTAVPTNGGATPAYQWKKNGGNVGTNSTTYSDAGLVNGDVITCELTSNATCATPTLVTSNSLTINVVTNTTPSVTITANPGSTICPGSSATFTAVAVNSGTTPSYQWKLNGGNVGTNSTTYTNGTLVTGDIVTCEVTSSDPCALPLNATSNAITMTVADLVNPTAVCQNVTVALNGGGTGTTTASAVNNGSSDNCTLSGSLVLSLSSSSFNCSNLGTNTVTLTVTDGAARTGTCNATVTVVDNILPAITCPSNINAGTGAGCNATVTYSAPNGTDNCTPTTTQIAGLASGASFPTGTTTNTFRVTDASGNSATCSFTVTVTDVTGPVAVCQGVTVSLNGGGTATTTATAVNNGSSDNCTVSGSLTLSLSGTTFTCANLGTNTRTLTVTDLSGNTGTCNATITVVDNIAPAITCPSNLSANNSSGNCTAAVNFTAPVGTDNCTPTTTQSAGLASGANFPVGTTTNTFTVADGSGNTATCSFTVTVTDVEAPAITCPANITSNNDAGQCAAAVTYAAPNGTDNCSGATTTQIAGNASGASFPVGTTTNTFSVTDAAGNSATCSFDVTVNDTEAPTFSNCPSNATGTTGVTCDGQVTWTAPTAADNCSVSGTTSTANPGDTFPLGNTTVTYTTTDAAGNTGTCSFTVTVTDATAPTALCINFAVTLNLSGNASIASTDIDGGSSDACGGVTTSVTPTTFTCSNVGPNTVTLTVTDGAGNTSTCTSTVTVSAQAMTATATSPTVNCGYNVSCNGATDGTATVTAGGGCPGYTYLWDNGNTTPTATGLGAGLHSVTVTDVNGGTTVATVTLTEPNPITVTSSSTNSCPGDSTGTADITADGGNDCSAYSFAWSNGETTEDLSGVAAGTYTVTVTDVNGCTGTTSVTVGAFTAPAPTFTVAGNTLTSAQTWTTYQWLLNGSPISGANSSSFTATVTGDYSLQVTDGNGCSGISGVTNVIVVAVEDPTQELLGLSIYPNPARGVFKLLAAQPIHQGLTVTIYDMHGHRFLEKAMPSLGNEVAFDIQNYSAGAYMVEVVTKSGHRKTFKLVVQ